MHDRAPARAPEAPGVLLLRAAQQAGLCTAGALAARLRTLQSRGCAVGASVAPAAGRPTPDAGERARDGAVARALSERLAEARVVVGGRQARTAGLDVALATLLRRDLAELEVVEDPAEIRRMLEADRLAEALVVATDDDLDAGVVAALVDADLELVLLGGAGGDARVRRAEASPDAAAAIALLRVLAAAADHLLRHAPAQEGAQIGPVLLDTVTDLVTLGRRGSGTAPVMPQTRRRARLAFRLIRYSSPDAGLPEALQRLSHRIVAWLLQEGAGTALQMRVDADGGRLAVALLAEVGARTTEEVVAAGDDVARELERLLDGCPHAEWVRVARTEDLRALVQRPDLTTGFEVVQARRLLPTAEGSVPVVAPFVPQAPSDDDYLADLLRAQDGPCSLIVSLSPAPGDPNADDDLAHLLAAAAAAEGRAHGLTVTQTHETGHGGQSIAFRRLPEDVSVVRAAQESLARAAEHLAGLQRGAMVVRLALLGQAEPTGTLRTALHEQWIGQDAPCGWLDVGPDQCAAHVAGPLRAVRAPATANPDGDVALSDVTTLAPWRYRTDQATSLFRLPVPPRAGWAGLPVDRFRPIDAPPEVLGDGGWLLGRAALDGLTTDVRLEPADLARHVYVCGKTGVGKSTLLLTLMADLARSPDGLVLVDPHGDLVDALRAHVPPGRRLVAFDPLDPACPTLNPLAHDGSPDGMDRALEVVKDLMFRQYARESMGPMFNEESEALLWPLIRTNLGLEQLSDVRWDDDFRERLLGRFDGTHPRDTRVTRFWEHTFPRRSEQSQADMDHYVLSKYTSLLHSAATRRVLSAGGAPLDIGAVMDRGDLLLARLPAGRLGMVSASFIGGLLVTRMLDAVFTRVNQSAADRHPVTLVYDEFQNFLVGRGYSYADDGQAGGDAVERLLAEARKFGLRLVLAHQYVAQLPRDVRAAVMGNAGNICVFRVGPADAELLVAELGDTVAATDLVDQPVFHATAKLLRRGATTRPFTLRTVSPAELAAVVAGRFSDAG